MKVQISNIDPHLWRRARVYAVEQNKTMGELVGHSLGNTLEAHQMLWDAVGLMDTREDHQDDDWYEQRNRIVNWLNANAPRSTHENPVKIKP